MIVNIVRGLVFTLFHQTQGNDSALKRIFILSNTNNLVVIFVKQTILTMGKLVDEFNDYRSRMNENSGFGQ